MGSHHAAVDRLGEGRPAGAAVELLAGVEQRRAAAGAVVAPRREQAAHRRAERPLGALAAGDDILLGRQPRLPEGRLALDAARRRDIALAGAAQHLAPVDQRRRLGLARLRQAPVRPHPVAGVAVRIVLQIVLMLRLGLPEGAGGLQLGHHRAGPATGGVHLGDRALGGLALRLAQPVDARAVGSAAVIALAVRRRRVMDLEEELQQRAVAQPRRVEDDLDRLGMRAVVAVGRVGHVAAAVAHAGRDDAGQMADQLLHAPEAAAGEDGGFGGGGGVHRRDSFA